LGIAYVSKVMMPLYFGELPIVSWLAIVGSRPPRGPVETARSAA
jgi:hypothetical protein